MAAGTLKIALGTILSPVALVPSASPVTLIYYYQVKEIRRILAKEAWAPLILGQRLIDGKVHLPALDGVPVLDLPASVPEGGERLVLRIIDEDIPVCQVENSGSPFLGPRIPS